MALTRAGDLLAFLCLHLLGHHQEQQFLQALKIISYNSSKIKGKSGNKVGTAAPCLSTPVIWYSPFPDMSLMSRPALGCSPKPACTALSHPPLLSQGTKCHPNTHVHGTPAHGVASPELASLHRCLARVSPNTDHPKPSGLALPPPPASQLPAEAPGGPWG